MRNNRGKERQTRVKETSFVCRQGYDGKKILREAAKKLFFSGKAGPL